MDEEAFVSSGKADELVRLAEADRIGSAIRKRRRAKVLRWMPGARRGGPILLGDRGIPWPAQARVLVIRPDHLGDVLLSGPSLARLRAGRPSDKITLLAGPWSEAIARRLAGPDAVETYRFMAYSRAVRRRVPGMGVLDVLRLALYIRRGRWDIVFVLRDDDFPSAWAAALAGVPVRVGHDDPGVAPLLTHALPTTSRPAHVTAAGVALVRAALEGGGAPADGPVGVDPALDTLAVDPVHDSPAIELRIDPISFERSKDQFAADPAIDPLSLRLEPEDEAAAARWIAALGELGPIGPGGPVAIHPGAGAAVKRWTDLKWAAVARALCAPGEPLILTGSAHERPITESIARLLQEDGPAPIVLDVERHASAASHTYGGGSKIDPETPPGLDQKPRPNHANVHRHAHPVLDLSGRMDIGALAALYARCRLVLGPDSGPLHIAAAVGTPSVSLFGPADPKRFGPWGSPGRHRVIWSDLPCAPCGRLHWPDPMAHPCVRVLSVSAVIEAAEACLRVGRYLPYCSSRRLRPSAHRLTEPQPGATRTPSSQWRTL